VTAAAPEKIVAGERAVLARRYATALLETAEKEKALDAVEADLLALGNAIAETPLFRAMAAHPRLAPSAVYKAMKAVMDGAKFHKITASFLTLVTRANRLALLDLVIDFFKRELAAKRRVHKAVVTVARAVTAEQEAALSAQLGKLVEGTVLVTFREDESLVGGMTIAMGSRLIDASVQGKLERLARRLKSQREAA